MYIINLDDKQSKGIDWVSSFFDKNTDLYCQSFGNEYIPQGVSYRIKDKSITHNIFKI